MGIALQVEDHRLRVIVNPRAGRGRDPQARARIEAIQQSLASAGVTEPTWEVSYQVTQAPGHAVELARRAVEEGYSLIAASGGDGTVGEVATAIAGTHATLAILPHGTGNDLARHLEIGRDLNIACQAIADRVTAKVDCGKANGRLFFNASSVGFDADVAYEINHGFRWLKGVFAYLAGVVKRLVCLKPFIIDLHVDDNRVSTEAVLCAVCNSRSYGGGLQVAPGARIDDGLFTVCLVERVSRVDLLRTLPRVFNGKHITHPKVKMFSAARVHIQTQPPVRLNVDGEIVGTTPVEFEIVPAALNVFVPHSFAVHSHA